MPLGYELIGLTLLDLDTTFVVAFIPMVCHDNICNVALQEVNHDVEGIHVFLPATNGITEEMMLANMRIKKQKTKTKD